MDGIIYNFIGICLSYSLWSLVRFFLNVFDGKTKIIINSIIWDPATNFLI